MKSFVALNVTLGAQPPWVGARLAQIDTSRGREQLYLNQRPELLLGLAEETRIASITASNAIEGVVVDVRRAEKLVRPVPARVRNRNEQEFTGYRDAMDGLMRQDDPEPVSVPLVLHLHRQLLGAADGRGGQLKSSQNLIVSDGGGERMILFTPTSPDDTPFALSELIDRYRGAADEEQAHPVLLIGLFVLDFLAIHPVADGNGRLARLLTSHLLRQRGYGIARYVSLEQRIFDTKARYYQALMHSQRGWHEARHDPWPWLEYLVGAVGESYARFEERVSASGPPGRSKQQRVRGYVLDQAGTDFKIADIRRALPGVSDQTIRLVLGALRDEGAIIATGVGPSARWRRRT